MALKDNLNKISTLVGHAKKAKVISKREAALLNLLTGITNIIADRVGVPGPVMPGTKNKKQDPPGEYIEYEEIK